MNLDITAARVKVTQFFNLNKLFKRPVYGNLLDVYAQYKGPLELVIRNNLRHWR